MTCGSQLTLTVMYVHIKYEELHTHLVPFVFKLQRFNSKESVQQLISQHAPVLWVESDPNYMSHTVSMEFSLLRPRGKH